MWYSFEVYSYFEITPSTHIGDMMLSSGCISVATITVFATLTAVGYAIFDWDILLRRGVEGTNGF